ncbi:hypothetical protein ACFX13_040372 [Malus domestica]
MRTLKIFSTVVEVLNNDSRLNGPSSRPGQPLVYLKLLCISMSSPNCRLGLAARPWSGSCKTFHGLLEIILGQASTFGSCPKPAPRHAQER